MIKLVHGLIVVWSHITFIRWKYASESL